MNNEELIKTLRVVPDFPRKGIMFFDITTMLKNPDAVEEVTNRLYELYKDKGITKVVGLESRGFIFAPILANKLHVGFVPIRKPGKLPADTIEQSYTKEYGTDTLQMHKAMRLYTAKVPFLLPTLHQALFLLMQWPRYMASREG